MTEYEESEEYFLRLKSIVELSDDAIIGTDLNGRIFSWNNGAKMLYGYSPAEVIGKSISIIIPPERQNEFMDILERIRLLSKGRIYDTFRTRKDGTRIEVSITVSQIMDKNGEIVGVSSIARDITELKRIANALHESEQKYRLIVDNSAEAIVVVQDGTLHFVNPAATTITGFSERELISKPFLQFIHPDDRALLGERYQKRLRGEEIPARYDFRVLAKDGNTKWLEISATAIDWKGRPATLNLLMDITDRKRAEEALREREGKISSILNTTVDWVYAIDTERNFIFISPSVLRITGYGQEEFLRDPDLLGRMIHPEDRDILQKHGAEFFSSAKMHEVSELEFRILHKNGDVRWISHSCGPLIDENNQFLGRRISNRDITTRKQAVIEIKKKTAEAIESKQKAEAYFDFLAHDIANILSPMIAYADMLKARPNNPEQVTKYSDEILEQGKRASSLISNLRRLESIEMTHPNEIDTIDLRSLFSALDDRIRSDFPNKEIAISYDIPNVQSMNVKGGEWVESILRCVYDNAVRYSTRSAAKLEIRASTPQQKGGEDFWQIEIADDGPGIPDNIKSHVEGSITVSGERQFKGVASSLPFSISMTKVLGGEMLIQDRIPGDYGQGTKVVIRLPKGE